MKKQILAATAILAFFISCTKSTTKTEKMENPDGSITTTTVTETKSGLVDSSKVDNAKQDVKNTLDKTGEKIDETAKKTKEELNQVGNNIKEGAKETGKDVKNAASKGAEKIEEGAKKLKEDLKK